MGGGVHISNPSKASFDAGDGQLLKAWRSRRPHSIKARGKRPKAIVAKCFCVIQL